MVNIFLLCTVFNDIYTVKTLFRRDKNGGLTHSSELNARPCKTQRSNERKTDSEALDPSEMYYSRLGSW